MKFKMYTTNYCGFCKQAARLLEQMEYEYETVSLDDPTIKRKFKEETGAKTVPQIYYVSDENEDWNHIGGFDELKEFLES